MKLSVIVPVYNVEKYLPRCLDSLLRQGMEAGEWEVICVNDGSPDNSGAILAEYERKHPDIFKVITQKNQGLGAARNVGMAMAQGEWVAFLDSDDYLVDGGFRYLLDHFCGDGEGGVKLDVLCYSFSPVYTDGLVLPDPDAKPDGEVTFEGDGVEAFNYKIIQDMVWLNFYRRSFLQKHHVEFEVVICEDSLFNFDTFLHHPHTRLVSSSIVRYENGNANSIQKTTDREAVLVQLNDLYYDKKRIQRYLDEGKTEMAPAANRLINGIQNNSIKKMLSVSLTRNEWKRYTLLLNLHRMNGTSMIPHETSWAARLVALLKKMAGHSYPEYRFVRFFHKNIFKRFLFAKIIGNEQHT